MQPLTILMLAGTIEDDRRRQRNSQRVWQPDEGSARVALTPSLSSAVERPRLKDVPAQG